MKNKMIIALLAVVTAGMLTACGGKDRNEAVYDATSGEYIEAGDAEPVEEVIVSEEYVDANGDATGGATFVELSLCCMNEEDALFSSWVQGFMAEHDDGINFTIGMMNLSDDTVKDAIWKDDEFVVDIIIFELAEFEELMSLGRLQPLPEEEVLLTAWENACPEALQNARMDEVLYGYPLKMDDESIRYLGIHKASTRVEWSQKMIAYMSRLGLEQTK